MVSGHTPQLDLISTRVRWVELYTDEFHYDGGMFSGAARKPPELPGNVTPRYPNDSAAPVGALIFFADAPLDCATIEFVNGARIMGPIDGVKRFMKGRKFFILNRWKDFICMELA